MKKYSKLSKKQQPIKVGHKTLYLMDDDYNTFDHVVNCLVTLCDHDQIQAEQCALLTHYKGSCEIAIGKIIDLTPLKEDLLLYGLDVEIL